VATDREGIAISVMVSFPEGDDVVWHRCHLTDIVDCRETWIYLVTKAIIVENRKKTFKSSIIKVRYKYGTQDFNMKKPFQQIEKKPWK
jgi:hypothetical protein